MLKTTPGHFSTSCCKSQSISNVHCRDLWARSHITMKWKLWRHPAVNCFRFSVATWNRDNPTMLNIHFPAHYRHICQCWKMQTNNLLLFFGVCLSILELLGFKYCKWIIYICTVYNFQVHEMDYQRLLWKNNPSKLYIKSYVSIFLMNSCPLSSLTSGFAELFNSFVWENDCFRIFIDYIND